MSVEKHLPDKERPGQPMPGNQPSVPGRDEGGGPTRKGQDPEYTHPDNASTPSGKSSGEAAFGQR
jgi:hypothetical protein